MKVTEQDLRNALLRLINNQLSVSFVGVVTNNEKAESEGFVTVKHNGLHFDVRLQAVTNAVDKGFFVVPTIESKVFCVSEANSPNSFVVASYTAIDKLIFNQADTSLSLNEESIQLTKGDNELTISSDSLQLTQNDNSLTVDSDGWKLNGGELEGLVIVGKLVKRLNTIENAFNSLLNNYKTHNHNHPQGTTTGLSVPYEVSEISETAVSDIENDKIKH